MYVSIGSASNVNSGEPPERAAIVEFRVEVPGRYLLVDHSLFRALEKGALGSLEVTGPDAPEIFRVMTPR